MSWSNLRICTDLEASWVNWYQTEGFQVALRNLPGVSWPRKAAQGNWGAVMELVLADFAFDDFLESTDPDLHKNIGREIARSRKLHHQYHYTFTKSTEIWAFGRERITSWRRHPSEFVENAKDIYDCEHHELCFSDSDQSELETYGTET